MTRTNRIKAQEALAKYQVDEVFQTKDGQVFLNKNRADLHASSVGGKVLVVKKDFVISNDGFGGEVGPGGLDSGDEDLGDEDVEDEGNSGEEDTDLEGMEASEDNLEEEEDLEAILSHPAKEVIEIVSVLGNPIVLRALYEAESLGKKRVTVLQSIKDAIETLTTNQRA